MRATPDATALPAGRPVRVGDTERGAAPERAPLEEEEVDQDDDDEDDDEDDDTGPPYFGWDDEDDTGLPYLGVDDDEDDERRSSTGAPYFGEPSERRLAEAVDGAERVTVLSGAACRSKGGGGG